MESKRMKVKEIIQSSFQRTGLSVNVGDTLVDAIVSVFNEGEQKSPSSDIPVKMKILTEPSLNGHQEYIGQEIPFQELERVILSGPKGIGKTLSVYSYAKKYGYSLLIFECSEEARQNELVGQIGLDEKGGGFFSLGILPTAVHYCNQGEKFILLFEEINALSPASQKLLNGLLDLKQGVNVDYLGRRFQIQNGKRLIVVGTMNPSVYGGVFELNEDLKSRFIIINLPYPPVDVERKIYELHTSDKDLIEKLLILAQETRSEGFLYQLSPRDIIQLIQLINLIGLQKGLRYFSGKFEGEDLQNWKARVMSKFGVQV